MSKIQFNGLTNTGAAYFYHFLCIYETRVKGGCSISQFPSDFPVAASLIDEMCTKGTIVYVPNQSYSTIPTNIVRGEKLYLLGTNRYADFFRHLRNALAHGSLNKKGDYYVYTDNGNVYHQNHVIAHNVLTACCRVKCNTINAIITDILKHI